jgi:hypothetical protein
MSYELNSEFKIQSRSHEMTVRQYSSELENETISLRATLNFEF